MKKINVNSIKSILILLSIIFLGTYKCSETLEVPDPKVDPVSFECVEVAQISYECADLISTKTDKMTGKTYTSNKEFLYISGKNRTGFRILCMKTTTYITIAIWDNEGVTSSYRSDDDDELEILFRDGSKLVLANDRQCYGVDFIIYFDSVFGKKKQLNELTTKEIETIRVWTSYGPVQQDFSNEQSKILMNTLKCLSQL